MLRTCLVCPVCDGELAPRLTPTRLLYRIPEGIPELASTLGLPTGKVWGWIDSGSLPLRVCNLPPFLGQEFVYIGDLRGGLKDWIST